MMNLPVSRPLCYADNAGRSGDRRCWRATCQGIPRNGSSRRCVWDGELYYSSSPNTHRIESRQCLKKRKRNPVIPPDADYLNLFGKSPVPAEAIHSIKRGLRFEFEPAQRSFSENFCDKIYEIWYNIKKYGRNSFYRTY